MVERLSRHGEQLPRTGLYEHFKSTPENPKYYVVTGFGQHADTGETFVIYETLDNEGGLVCELRPLATFMETVEVDGKTVRRFNSLQ